MSIHDNAEIVSGWRSWTTVSSLMAYPSFVENDDSIIARIRRPHLMPSPTFGYSSKPHAVEDNAGPLLAVLTQNDHQSEGTIMRSLSWALTILVALALPISANAAPEPQDPKKQTPWHLYLDAKEAYEMKMAKGDQVLFIDVREPIEIMFTGFTDVVDVNVPFLIANRGKWHPTKPNFAMEKNPDFEPAIALALGARGLTKETPVIVMCRSGGTRGAPSAIALWGKGYKQVYVVVDGFEGGAIKEGPKKNWRLKDGWKNAGLPWSYKLNKEKMYFVK